MQHPLKSPPQLRRVHVVGMMREKIRLAPLGDPSRDHVRPSPKGRVVFRHLGIAHETHERPPARRREPHRRARLATLRVQRRLVRRVRREQPARVEDHAVHPALAQHLVERPLLRASVKKIPVPHLNRIRELPRQRVQERP